jgi:hypothetical protein
LEKKKITAAFGKTNYKKSDDISMESFVKELLSLDGAVKQNCLAVPVLLNTGIKTS